MSEILLNSINVSKVGKRSVVDYIASIVDSKSGPLEPEVISDKFEFESKYGDIKYKEMYLNIIDKGFGVCLLPLKSIVSEFNLSSLRLLSTSKVSSHPRINQDIHDQLFEVDIQNNSHYEFDKIDYSKLSDGIESLSYYLDFTDISDIDSNDNYIILDSGLTEIGFENRDILISGAQSEVMLPPQVSQSQYYTKYAFIRPYTVESKYDWIESLVDWMNSLKLYTLDNDELSDTKLLRCFNLKLLINRFINNLDLNDPILSYDLSFVEQWKSEIIENSKSIDFYKYSNVYVIEILNQLFNALDIQYEANKKHGINPYNKANLTSLLNSKVIDNNKLVIISMYPLLDLNQNYFKSLDFGFEFNASQDTLCLITNKQKICDFYSKYRGPVGNNISIEIKEYNSVYPGIYNLHITNDIIVEDYLVRLTDVHYNDLSDVIYLGDIESKSSLVKCRVYNYWLNGNLICDRYFDNLKYTYDTQCIRQESELSLPTGKFNLNRNIDEVFSEEDLSNTLRYLSSSEIYPNLLLVDSIPNIEFIQNIIENIQSIDQYNGLCTQALINLDYKYLSNKYKLFSIKNLITYFYGEIELSGVRLPQYYPYLMNILGQTYLGNIRYRLLSDLDTLKSGNVISIDNYDNVFKVIDTDGSNIVLEYGLDNSICSATYVDGIIKISGDSINTDYVKPDNIFSLFKDKYINVIDYNNLEYYYSNILEFPNQGSNFIITYILLSYTRSIYKNRHRIIGIKPEDSKQLIQSINKTLSSKLKLVESSKVSCNINTDSISVKFTINIKKIINKIFNLNITLNV